MSKVKSAVKALNDAIAFDLEFDGCIREDTDTVTPSLAIVSAGLEEWGEVWLATVNRRNKEGSPIVKYDGENARWADFALPVFDAELERLLLERENAEYTGTKADSVRIHAIYKRAAEIKGETLIWS